MKRTRVVIVGGGPVGVGLAVELGMRGIPCAVVEQRSGLSAIPKGQRLTQRTVEHFHFWGLEPQLHAARTMTPGHPIANLNVYGTLLGDIWDVPPGPELVRDYYFTSNERLPQYRTEEVLRERLRELACVECYFGWRAGDLACDEDGARLVITRDGDQQVLEADYVVGCDGGHSMVRDRADIARSGADFDAVMALAVFRSRDLHQTLERFPPCSTYRVVHPELNGYWRFFGRVDVGEGFFFHAPIPAGADPDAVDIAALLHAAAGYEFPFTIDHFGVWDLRVQVAQSYRAGRVFIAGDAAHTHPPYGGFGLNNGLEDAVNLGWKLAAVLHGWGGDRLLDSYSDERRQVFRDIGEDIIAAGIRRERDFLAAHSPERDGTAAFAELFKAQAFVSFDAGVSYEPHYDGSPVVCAAAGATTGALGRHSLAARAGHHLAPRALSDGRDVYEALGPWFTLLALDSDDRVVACFEQAAAEAGIPLAVVRDDARGERGDYQARAVLVRPDQFVAWTGDGSVVDTRAVLRRVSGNSG